MTNHSSSIAILIPCFNEEKTIEKVVQDFHRELPNASIFVFDNNSRDSTKDVARRAGATVIHEKRQGKGCVISSMFKKIDADFFIMVDGDDTYPAEFVHDLLEPIYADEADMVVGERLSLYSKEAFRPMHKFGNNLVCWMINQIFHSSLRDPMSGYRAFTRAVVEAAPIIARGFDIETELTLQLLNLGFVIKEKTIPYRNRPEGSVSKLRTYTDGFRVIIKILSILIAYKPLTFFGSIGMVLAIVGMWLGSFPIYEYFSYHYIFSVPKAILAASLMVLAGLCVLSGLIINTINFRLFEIMSLFVKQNHRHRNLLLM
jgi:glycosyltransferase involved in cell wall biosynthesis